MRPILPVGTVPWKRAGRASGRGGRLTSRRSTGRSALGVSIGFGERAAVEDPLALHLVIGEAMFD